MDSPVFCEIDLDAEGKHQGFLRTPHSVHRSAYGWIGTPIVSIKNGEGPGVLLMAGNHGDEYEGQVSLATLSRELDSKQVQGQVIILPMANSPAAMAGMRTSPIDKGNLNRNFPGNPDGTPTEVIANFIETCLLARVDHLFDIHSGGSSLEYFPSLMMPRIGNPQQQKNNIDMLQSMGFDKIILYEESTTANFSSSAARRQAALPITAEMAGGGSVNTEAVQLLDKALYRYIEFIGILKSKNEELVKPSCSLFEISDYTNYVHAYHEGVFEPIVKINDRISRGEAIGYIHFPDRPWLDPEKVYSQIDATVLCRRVPARVRLGDCLFELGTPVTR